MTLRQVLAAAALAASLTISAAPKYIFYFIADGMGIGEVVNAELFNRELRHGGDYLLMRTFPITSMISTRSASSNVTDSSAAGTALACGHKTRNGMLGMTADTVAVASVAKKLYDNGYGIGLVTTVAIDDATPGAFYANVPNRGMYYVIGRQLAESGYQFMAGAGLRGTRDSSGNENDLMKRFADAGVTVSYGMENVNPFSKRQLLLNPPTITDKNNVGYVIDSIPGALTIEEMTRAGIRHLMNSSPDKFFMMVEGGNIDHAGHSNDGATNILETIAFDRALREAYYFYLSHQKETLIIVTADHETGGMSAGNNETGYATYLDNLAGQRVSKDTFNDYCRDLYNRAPADAWTEMKAYLAWNFGLGNRVKVTENEWLKLREEFDKVFINHDNREEKTLYNTYNAFVGDVVRLVNSKAGIGWSSTAHTGAYVPVFAIGCDSEQFMYLIENTDLPLRLMNVAGVRD